MTNASKRSTYEDVVISTVRSVLAHAYRCRKYRGSLIQSPTVITPREQLEGYLTLKQTDLKRLVGETLAERSEDRQALELPDFLSKWPFLRHQCGLRMEFMAIKGVKNLNYISDRVRRNAPCN